MNRRIAPEDSEVPRGVIAVGGLVAAAIVVLPIIWGSWYTIDQTERGVILRNGAIKGIAQPGLGFKMPIVDTVVELSVQTHIERFDKMHAYSADQQPAEMRISVNYRLQADKVGDIYAQFGSIKGVEDRLIRPHVEQQAKIIFGRFTAVRAIQERAKLNADVADSIQASLSGPVVIESVQIENIDFSKAYEASIEQRMLAEVEVQKIRQNAEREKVQAEILVIQARAQADATVARAKAEADAITLRGNAEALAIKARGDALKENPTLVTLTQAERWDGKLPVTMVPGGSVPMLTLGRTP